MHTLFIGTISLEYSYQCETIRKSWFGAVPSSSSTYVKVQGVAASQSYHYCAGYLG